MQNDLALGEDARFLKAVSLADHYARSEWPVLLLGETGVGKELMARRIHRNSYRQAGPFVPVNCGAIPPGLFEAELFGFEKGAFSGAVQSSRGLIRSAREGTLFLDEVGDLDLASQVKLLRFLDSGEVRPLGSTRLETAEVRIVAATNVELHAAVDQGRFRQDLLERIAVLSLKIPPLRERPSDIAAIARELLKGMGASFAEPVLRLLSEFDWPGNVRQLRNVLVRAMVRGQGTLIAPILDAVLEEEKQTVARAVDDSEIELEPFAGSLAEIEKRVIVDRLRRCHGNRKLTAQELGIAKSTLHEKLRQWRQTEPTSPLWRSSRSASVASVLHG